MQNDAATCEPTRAESVQVCSPDVRSNLIKRARRELGPTTPAGRRCFNLDEMLQNRETATGDQLANLNYQIGVQVRDLAKLTK